MPFYERGSTRIYYEEAGSGFPLLIIPGGGLNGTLASLQSPFNPMERYKDDFRCIAADRRNAYSGQSSGPLEIDRPWDSYSDDHLFYQNNMESWGPPLCEQRSDLTMDMVSDFLTSMYTDHPGFVFSVTRDFVGSMQTPLLIAPDDVPSHPYKMALEVAELAPNTEVTIYPWKDSPERIDEVVEHARRFLKAHVPVAA